MVGVLLVATFLVARSCQQGEIRVTQDEAIATAKQQVDFVPTRTQVRLLRQGVSRKPFWFVSLSIPLSKDPNANRFSRLTVVEIDANTGKVEKVDKQIPAAGDTKQKTG